jgi:hypothetical protein
MEEEFILLALQPEANLRLQVAKSLPRETFCGLRLSRQHLAAVRVRSNLLAVILGAAATLASEFAPRRLPRLVFRWLEDPLTVAASPFDHTGGCRILRSAILSRRFRNCYSVCTASWPMAGFL